MSNFISEIMPRRRDSKSLQDLRGDKHPENNPDKNVILCDGMQYRLLEQLSAPIDMDEFESFCAKFASSMCVRISLTPSLDFKGYSAQEYHFRIAESQFLRISRKSISKVIRVDYIYNANLREQFYGKKEEFKKLKTPHEERLMVAFNLMADETEKIVYKGFQAESCVLKAFDPETFLGGRTGLKTALLCHALLGNQGTDHEQCSHYERTHHVKIKSGSQLLPKYVVQFR